MDADEKWEKAIEHELSKIEENPDILEANKETIRKFKTWLKGNRKAMPATIWRHIYCWGKLCQAFDKSTNIIEATSEDVEKALEKIEDMKTVDGKKMADQTKEKTKSTLKFLFKHFKGKDTFYPPEVWSVKIKVDKQSNLTADDLVSEEDFATLHKRAKTPRTHAILEILKLPIRPQEIIALKRKHLVLGDRQPYLLIPARQGNGRKTKTGGRRIPLFETTYLAQYINNYAQELEPDDALFTYSEWSNKETTLTKRPMTYTALNALIRKLQRKAGVRNYNLYRYRHTAITRLLGGAGNTNVPLSVNQAVIVAGTKAPTLEAVYQHLTDHDIDVAMARAHGEELEDAPKPKATNLDCSFCHKKSSIQGVDYCPYCGMAYSMAVRLNDEKHKEEVKTDLLKAFGNPEERENLKVLLKEIMAEQAVKKKARK